jgi:hypothetical protein
MLSVVMLSVIMLSVIILSVIMLSVVMLSVIAPLKMILNWNAQLVAANFNCPCHDKLFLPLE